MTGDITMMGAYIGAGFATFGMGMAAIGVSIVVGAFLRAVMEYGDSKQSSNLFIGIAFAEALGIFSFLVALLLMFAL